MPLSTIFQLYCGSQFYWWRKPENTEKTTDLHQSLTQTIIIIEVQVFLRRNAIISQIRQGNRHFPWDDNWKGEGTVMCQTKIAQRKHHCCWFLKILTILLDLQVGINCILVSVQCKLTNLGLNILIQECH
jgi:hypothetical protein